MEIFPLCFDIFNDAAGIVAEILVILSATLVQTG